MSLNTTQKHELRAWGKAFGFVLLIAVTAALLVLAGLSTI